MSNIQTIQNILSTPKNQRTPEQISELISILKPLKLFKNLLKSPSALSSICQLLQFEFHSASDYVFKYGDIGTHYYIILEGRVSLQIPKSIGKSLAEVMVYEKFSGFGEIALEAYKNRGGSAYCLTDCYFLTLEKKDYLEHMQGFLSDKKRNIVNFLVTLPFFNQMSRILLSKLTYNINEVVFRKGQLVIREGEEPGKVFILRSGECQVTKKMKKELSPIRSLKNTAKYCNFIVKTVMDGALIGEEAALNNLPSMFSYVVSSESAVLYQISAKEFFARVNSDELLKYLQKQSQLKEKNLNDWETKRSKLERVFDSPEKERGREENKTVGVVNKFRLRNCVSEKKIPSRSGSCKKIENYTKVISKPNILPILSRASSNTRSVKGLSVMPLNPYPILNSLYSP